MITTQLIKYLIVGSLNTLVGLLVIFGAMGLWHAGAIAANVIGYAVGLSTSFALNRRWTFAHRGRIGASLMRFVAVQAVAYLANLAVLMALIRYTGINHYVAQCIAIVPYLVIGFAGSRSFAFSPHTEGAGAQRAGSGP